MTSRSGEVGEDSSSVLPPLDFAATHWRLLPFLMLSAWCGLVAGLLEVGIVVLRKQTFDFNHLYWMSRHFVWLIPLINLALFLILGLALLILAWCTGPARTLGRCPCAMRSDVASSDLGGSAPDLRCRGFSACCGDRIAPGPGA